MIYIFSFTICIYFAFLASYKKENKKLVVGTLETFFVFLSLFPLFMLYAFRGSVGIDYYSYIDIFNVVQYAQLKDLIRLSSELEKESLFLFVNYVGFKLGLGINFVYFFCATITFYFFYKAITYYDFSRKYLIVSIIIFNSQIFFFGLDAVRQIPAVMIYFYATKYIHKRKIYKFLLWVFIASAFHTSALLLIPTYFILHKNIKTLVYIPLCLTCLFLSVVFKPLMLVEVIEKIAPNWKYIKYMYDDVSYEGTVGVVYFIHLITCIVISVLKKEKNNDNRKEILVNMYLFFTMLFPLLTPFLSTKRFLFYFWIGMTLGVPFGIEKLKNSRLKRYLNLILFIYCLIFTFLFLSSIRSGYLHPEWLHEPYKFIFM